MTYFLIRWLLGAIAIGLTAYILPGIKVDSIGALILTSLVLGILNAIMRPVLVILTLPATILSLGLFLFVINAFLLWLAGVMVSGFHVEGFGWALLGSLLITIINAILGMMFGVKKGA
jgi:putative membrane protein